MFAKSFFILGLTLRTPNQLSRGRYCTTRRRLKSLTRRCALSQNRLPVLSLLRPGLVLLCMVRLSLVRARLVRSSLARSSLTRVQLVRPWVKRTRPAPPVRLCSRGRTTRNPVNRGRSRSRGSTQQRSQLHLHNRFLNRR